MNKAKILIALAMVAVFLTAGFSFKPKIEAYGNSVGHPKLTEKIAELYNYIYDPDLTQKEIDLLIQGASDEDTPPRWINHFYDPTTGQGWLGKRLGDIPEETVRQIAKIAFNKEAVSALNWANNQELQNSEYSLYQGNRAFDSAVLYYLKGKKEEAYYTLGYILHLVEDMTVPAHTRQDTHFDTPVPDIFEQLTGVQFDRGEPYEKWVEENGYIDQTTIDILKNNYQPICSSLDSCLIYLANYSNNGFFSEDSILDKEYNLPKIERIEHIGEYGHAYDKQNKLLFLAKREKGTGFLIDKTTDLPNINQSYWNQLFPVAILGGVEVVKYFHEQAEKARNNEIALGRPGKIGFLDKVKSISLWGEVARVAKYASAAVTNPFHLWFGDSQEDGEVKSQSSSLLTDLGLTPEEAQERADDLQELLDLLNRLSEEEVNPLELPSFEPPSFEPPILPPIELPTFDPPTLGLPDLGMPPLLQPEAQNQTPTQLTSNPTTYISGGGSGTSTPNYCEKNDNSQPTRDRIIINEVAWMGTGDSSANEWIEIKNISNEQINLNSWQILDKEKQIKIIFTNQHIISPGSFYLLERTSDDSVPAIASDIIYTGALNDSDEALYLFDESCALQDEILAETSWPAGDKESGKTMERKSDLTWQTSVNSGGTPKTENSQPLILPPSPLPPPPSNPSKILISEVQIDSTIGIGGTDDDWVELYNPYDIDVSLTDWSIQKHSADLIHESCSINIAFQKINLLKDAIIPAKGYFLIVRNTASQELLDLADMTSSYLQLSPNNTIYLVRNQELIESGDDFDVVDKVGFGLACFPETEPALNPSEGKSVGRKKLGIDTENNSADFEIQNPTPKTDNISSAPPEPEPDPEPTDNVAPSVAFDISAIQESLSFAINFTITDLSIEGVSPSGLAVFQFRWQEEGGEWQEDVVQNVSDTPASYNVSRDFTASRDETSYYFQVKAKDINDNESEWLPEESATTLVRTPKKILINEVQIDGLVGVEGTGEDWVELYNPYDFDVSLAGWSIQKHSSSNPCSIDTAFYRKNFSDDAVIPAHGFYLIVSVRANVSLLALADMVMPLSWSLTDNGTVYLVRNQDDIESGEDPDIIDKVAFGEKSCFSEGSPAPNPLEGGSIERKLIGADTDNNSQDFRTLSVPTPKSGSPLVTIQDITDYPTCEGGGSPGTMYYYLKIKWQSPSTDIEFYQVQYKINNGSWQDWFSQTIETEATFRVLNDLFNDHIYYFRVKAKDLEGNISNWAQIEVDVRNPVVINEVALYGTNNSRDDQWIELYNKSDDPVDVTGWRLRGGSDGYEKFTLSLQGVIPAKGHIVLERIDDQVISNLAASQIFPEEVPNTYGNFYLENEKGRKVDSLYLPPWPGWSEAAFLVDGNYYSIERISPYAFGNVTYRNWEINNGQIINSHDRDGNPIYGTPGQQNSNYQLYTLISLDFVEDMFLPKSLSPYLFNDRITVFENTTLTIEPGVIIKFRDLNTGIYINGTMKAIGTATEPILFTSNQETPQPGFWGGLQFSQTSVNSELENIIVHYAGDLFGGYDFGAGIKVDRSSISLRDSVIQSNSNNGVRLINSTSIIDSVQILDHKWTTYLYTEGKGIRVEGGSPSITNSFFARNYYAIYMISWWDPDTGTEVPAIPYIDATNTFEDNSHDIWPPPPEEP